jgi:hypothetical protein
MLHPCHSLTHTQMQHSHICEGIVTWAAATTMGQLTAAATTMGQFAMKGLTTMNHLRVAATMMGRLVAAAFTMMGQFATVATMMGELAAEACTATKCLVVDVATTMGNGNGASCGGGERGYGSRAAACGGGYNDCTACVGDHNDGATPGGGYSGGVAARGSGLSTRFAVCGYEGPSHREHLRSLPKLQQYHRKNSITDSMGDLSEDNGHDDMTDFEDAFL